MQFFASMLCRNTRFDTREPADNERASAKMRVFTEFWNQRLMISRVEKGLSLRLRIIEVAVRTLLPLVGAGLLAAGLVGLVSFAVLPLVESFTTRNWVAVEARVDSVRVIPTGYIVPLPIDMIEVRYSYDYEGQRFESTRFGPHEGLESRKRTSKFVGDTNNNGVVRVWVDADDPMRATVLRDVNWVLVALALPALIFLALGLLLVLASMVIWNDRRSIFRDRGAGRTFFTDND